MLSVSEILKLLEIVKLTLKIETLRREVKEPSLLLNFLNSSVCSMYTYKLFSPARKAGGFFRFY